MKTLFFRMMLLALFLLPLLGRGLGGGCVLFAQDLSVCYGKGYTLKPNAPATGATPVTYQWYEDGKPLDGESASSLSIPAGKAAGEYKYVRVASNAECAGVPSNTFTVRVDVAPVAPTGLASNTTMFCNSEFTAATLTVSGGSAGSYEWGTGNTVGNNSLGTTAGNTYAVSPSAPTTYWVRMKGAGACSTTATEGMTTAIWVYTEPEPVGYFGSYNPNSASPATYVTLYDGRDTKIYPVVKIGGRWIMARNLNYQGTTGNPSSSLTWHADADSPSTASGSNTALIGHFWCPGGAGQIVPTSTRAGCDVWGALYSWETAMSADGKGTWTESPSTYNTGAANSAAAKANHGRITSGTGRGGRGICPPDWHVPTDYEWGIIFDAMESNVSTAHQTASGNDAWYGIDAGLRSRSKCTGAANDTRANWMAGTPGTDDYGFRALPTGYRLADGNYFSSQGYHANFWSSSAYDASYAWRRDVRFNYDTVYRNDDLRSHGYSVRCIMD